jgi:hypothetical protein
MTAAADLVIDSTARPVPEGARLHMAEVAVMRVSSAASVPIAPPATRPAVR